MLPTGYYWKGATVYRAPDYDDYFIVYHRTGNFAPKLMPLWSPSGTLRDVRAELMGKAPKLEDVGPYEGTPIRKFQDLLSPSRLDCIN